MHSTRSHWSLCRPGKYLVSLGAKPQPDFIPSSANCLKPTKSAKYRQQIKQSEATHNFTHVFTCFYTYLGKQDAFTSQSASFDGFTVSQFWNAHCRPHECVL